MEKLLLSDADALKFFIELTMRSSGLILHCTSVPTQKLAKYPQLDLQLNLYVNGLPYPGWRLNAGGRLESQPQLHVSVAHKVFVLDYISKEDMSILKTDYPKVIKRNIKRKF